MSSSHGSLALTDITKTGSLALTDITKTYPGVRALRGVSLEVRPGEIHGLVGENGAGKSTLMGVASGTVQPDAGEVRIGGDLLERADPALARRLGLAIVHQEPALMPDLTVAENMLLGQRVDLRPRWGESHEWSERALERWTRRRPISPSDYVRDLRPDQRFIVELSKACAFRPKVLVLDEPTEHLVAADVETLFAVVRELAAAGTAVVYISHHISEVIEISDRISVLRDGVYQGTVESADVDYDQIVTRIVGRELEAEFPPKRSDEHPLGAPVLKVAGLSGERFSGVSFEVHPGEIVGLAGVEGNGQREVIRSLAGVVRSQGEVTVGADRVSRGNPAAAARNGVAFVPNDRHREGILGELGVRENIAVGTLRRLSSAGIMRRGREREAVAARVASLRVATPTLDTPVPSLSGGNQQKVIFGRALERQPKLILADEPTQGVDVGARAEIYTLLRGALADGAAAVVVSSNQVELEGLCDRVLVFSRGQVVRELAGAEVTEAAIIETAMTTTTTRVSTVVADGTARRLRQFFRGDFAPPLITLIFTLLLATVAATQNAAFLSPIAIGGLLTAFALYAFASLAQQVVTLVGGIDLSVGPLMGFLVVASSFFIVAEADPGMQALGWVLLVVITVAVATINFAPMLIGVPPLLTTLVTFTALQGLSLLLRPVPGGNLDLSVLDIIGYRIGPIPVAAVLAILVGVGLDIALRRTTWGVSLRGVGSSVGHASTVGLRVRLIQYSAFILAGVLTLLAAVLLMNQVGSGDATAGITFTLFSITAVVVGGTSITGGRGKFVGALAGALLIVVINSAVTFLNLSTAWQTYMVGLLIIAAAGIYSRLRSRRA